MGRLDYAILFFTGKKSTHMKSIERRFPKLEGFDRKSAFFHAFGNLVVYDRKHTLVMLLPANQKFSWINAKNIFDCNCKLFNILHMKNIKTELQKTVDGESNVS